MTHPTTLYSCNSQHDACYLKNVIHRTSFIPIEVRTINKKLCLITDKSNYYKAKIIIATHLNYLPSIIAKKNAKLITSKEECNYGDDFIFKSNLGKMLQKFDLLVRTTKYGDLSN